MITLVSVVVVVNGLHSRIKQYPKVTLDTCGIGRQSLLMTTGQCLHYNMTANIQNGRLAEPGEWPWIAYVFVQKYFLFIIPTDRPGYKITVRAVSDRRLTYKVDISIVHNKYNTDDGNKDSKYDIGLLKLISPLPIPTITTTTTTSGGQPYRPLKVNGICLPDKDIVNTEDELALNAGYGYIDEGVVNYGPLRMNWIIIKKTINNFYDGWGNWIISYRYPPNTGSAICKGDSGGPLVQYVGDRAVLIGLTSASSVKVHCLSDKPKSKMIFIRVSRFIDWIVDTIENN
ncbi:chymotrypsin-like protease CTRL-1 [Oppia nitens]|uniref:chymotrypsin-like protease CTRL-1 n=1 Tax=Oppia nitens TaxID=1686743 RepID=UPI0023DC0385|nr:chymotrypsin-like protease CTRL-1 [Oppia nitens]